jgi:ABC-type lipoprotein release transport system permease subunit
MRRFVDIAYTGVAAVLLHPLRSGVTVACVVAVLAPYLAGLGVSKGVAEQAAESIRSGADMYVTGERFGRTAPLPLERAQGIRALDGVTRVVPRIVGRLTLGKDDEEAVLVGISPRDLPSGLRCVEGTLYDPASLNDLVIGTELARRLGLHVGSLIPPFYQNPQGERVSRIVGVFRSDVSLWQARLILTSFATASAVFAERDTASDLLVYCRAGYEEAVSRSILRLPATGGVAPRLRVATARDLDVLLPRGLLHREGIFNLHFLLGFAVSILVVLVTSGFGLAERRREIGILKATGWQTDEVLWRSVAESVVLAVAAAALSVLLAFAWLRLFNGYWVASLFLAGVGTVPAIRIPARLTPVPALVALVMSLAVVMIGTLYASWRAATVPPTEAMR